MIISTPFLPTLATAEVTEGCNGFMSGLQYAIGNAHVLQDKHDRLAVVTGERLKEKAGSERTAVLYSDAASTTLWGRGESEYGLIGGATFAPHQLTHCAIENPLTGYYDMNGPMVAQAIKEYGTHLVKYVIQKYRLDKAKVRVIFHQMNGGLLENLHQLLGLEAKQVVNTFSLTPNTSGTTIPSALYHCLQEGIYLYASNGEFASVEASLPIREGDYIIFAAAGTGFNMGVALYRASKPLLIWNRDITSQLIGDTCLMTWGYAQRYA